MRFLRNPISSISLVCGETGTLAQTRSTSLEGSDAIGSVPYSALPDLGWASAEGEPGRDHGGPAHLRAAGQGVEEVEEHEAREGHGGGAWCAGSVLRDLGDTGTEEAKDPIVVLLLYPSPPTPVVLP